METTDVFSVCSVAFSRIYDTVMVQIRHLNICQNPQNFIAQKSKVLIRANLKKNYLGGREIPEWNAECNKII